mmetsp:Transcript_41980/g.99632  ORF Transcript_41980/g.99632 Transcript_41980/m.99632 type:complete len:281 (-) Transcript_41980:251-1093(-)
MHEILGVEDEGEGALLALPRSAPLDLHFLAVFFREEGLHHVDPPLCLQCLVVGHEVDAAAMDARKESRLARPRRLLHEVVDVVRFLRDDLELKPLSVAGVAPRLDRRVVLEEDEDRTLGAQRLHDLLPDLAVMQRIVAFHMHIQLRPKLHVRDPVDRRRQRLVADPEPVANHLLLLIPQRLQRPRDSEDPIVPVRHLRVGEVPARNVDPQRARERILRKRPALSLLKGREDRHVPVPHVRRDAQVARLVPDLPVLDEVGVRWEAAHVLAHFHDVSVDERE